MSHRERSSWSDADIEAAKKALREEGQIKRAAIKLSHRLKRKITKGSLATAFYNKGLKTSDYIES